MMGSRPSFLGRTAICGVGATAYTRSSGRSVLALAVEACRGAIADAGLEPKDVDGIMSYHVLNDSVGAQAVATALGFGPQRYVADLELGGQAPAFMVMNAAMAVDAHLARHVVAFRALNGRSGVRVGSGEFHGPAGQYRYPLGFTAYPQYMALWTRRYMIETGATEEDLAAVVIQQRLNAASNERAVRRGALTLEQYFAAEYVAEPFRVPDCTVEVDGACAVVITSADDARRLTDQPAIVQGAAFVTGPRSGLDIGDSLLWEDLSRNFTSHLSSDLWRSAGMRPSDMDFAQIYDCFSGTVLLSLEGLGLVDRGEAGAFFRSGAAAPGGRLAVNTNGGLLCEGYIQGMNTLAEAVIQIQGRAGARQLARADRGVVTSGAMSDGSALILTRD